MSRTPVTGKSTILRQACIALILGQLGCEVPAQSATFTPVDRIFSRVGAHDEIMKNQSTFFVECKEAAHILANASPRSLVIMDELGRGTSTFDGTAIAMAVVNELRRLDCMSLFSTHYHMLISEYSNEPGVALYHMTSREEEALPFNSPSPSTSPSSSSSSSKAAAALLKDVTFLYKFMAGVCSKSFGLNVARMAGIDDEVVREAAEVSAIFEKRLMRSHGGAKKGTRGGIGGDGGGGMGGQTGQTEKGKGKAGEGVKKGLSVAAQKRAAGVRYLMHLKAALEYAEKMEAAGQAVPVPAQNGYAAHSS